MSSNTSNCKSSSSDVVAPLLEESSYNKGTTPITRWCKKLLDLEEAKDQMLFSLPLILTNMSFYLITLISVMFAGHLGATELAGATLAGSWATVTGFAFMTGLSGAIETLCGQSYGAKLYKMMGIYLQAACVISFLFCVIISVIWFYTEPILILLQQDPKISATAAQYMKFLIPGLFAYGFLQQILRFLQVQSVVVPQIMFSFIPMCIHVGIVYVLVHFTPLGFKGAPVATSISLWIPVFMLVVYIMYSKNFEHTWAGFSSESFLYIVRELKLALPSAAMVCLEYWAFEILVFVAGLMTNPELATSLIAMCANTESVAYMLTYGLSAAASTRVSNELGAGNPDKAKHAMAVTVKLSILLAVGVVLALAFGHNIWAGFFSDSPVIITQFAYLSPFLAISITLDSIQGVLSGVARGCGWQHLAMYANFGTFYLIGLPIACLLGFKLNLYVKGLWIGLNCGLCCQAATLLLITLRTKWAAIDLSERRDKEERVIVV